jgi:hypothetical protein
MELTAKIIKIDSKIIISMPYKSMKLIAAKSPKSSFLSKKRHGKKNERGKTLRS